MTAKRFGAKLIPAGSTEIVMTGAAQSNSVVVLYVTNQGNTTTKISIAYIDSSNIADLSQEDWLVFQKPLFSGDFIDLRGVAVEDGHSLVVYTEDEPVSSVAFGITD